MEEAVLCSTLFNMSDKIGDSTTGAEVTTAGARLQLSAGFEGATLGCLIDNSVDGVRAES